LKYKPELKEKIYTEGIDIDIERNEHQSDQIWREPENKYARGPK
jgi:hypothetical protein